MDDRRRRRICDHQSLDYVRQYDHIGLPPTTVPFPTVAVINANTIAVKQSVDPFKVGVNNKFDFGPWAAVTAKN
jgi:hypothetical protein